MQTRKVTVILRVSRYNIYTMSTLMGLLQDKLNEKKFNIVTCDNFKDIMKLIKKNKRTILAYSFCSPQLQQVKNEILLVRERFGTNITIISGGPHVTAIPESVLKIGADFVFTGEAEGSLPSFMNLFYENSLDLKEKIRKPLPLKDFNTYPPFAYKVNWFTPIELRRGCNLKCTFCQTPRMFKEIRERSLKYVLKYGRIIKKNGRNRIYFTISDALLYGSKKGKVNLLHLEKFLKALKENEFDINFGSFPSELSPGNINRHPEAIPILEKYLGNKKIILGGQSGSDKVLKIMKRDHTVEQITSSVDLLKKHGFFTTVDMLFGIPGETHADRLKTLKYIQFIIQKYKVRINLHYFMPLPGTSLGKENPEKIENDIKNALLKLIKNGYARGDFFKQIVYFSK